MKKFLIVLLAMVFMAGFAGTASAVSGISGTMHDFTAGGDGDGLGQGENTEICSTCHTPHANPLRASEGPLWDHELTANTVFTPYDSTTLDADVDSTIGSVSKLCLSCHDGTVAIDSFGDASGDVYITTGDAFISTDLSNDHPVSFTYDGPLATLDGELVSPFSADEVTSGGLPLFDGSQLECATCHNAHETDNSKFLRVDNTGSALCKECHNK